MTYFYWPQPLPILSKTRIWDSTNAQDLSLQSLKVTFTPDLDHRLDTHSGPEVHICTTHTFTLRK